MSLNSTVDRIHAKAKNNKWMRYFTVFNRIGLAAGFLPSGFVKVNGERFTVLSNDHPMGNYLEALHHTGEYYTFIGVAQMSAAVLLLIPRTATLGAILYFPIILNICILSLAVCFEGSLISSPLMVLANLYLLCWDYDKLKYILPLNQNVRLQPENQKIDNKFPIRFFAGAFAAVVLVIFVVVNMYDIKPRNSLNECNMQGSDSATNKFCECIHAKGKSYDKCLEGYRSNVKVSK